MKNRFGDKQIAQSVLPLCELPRRCENKLENSILQYKVKSVQNY